MPCFRLPRSNTSKHANYQKPKAQTALTFHFSVSNPQINIQNILCITSHQPIPGSNRPQPWPSDQSYAGGATPIALLALPPGGVGSYHQSQWHLTSGGFHNSGYPNGWLFTTDNPQNMDDLRVPLF